MSVKPTSKPRKVKGKTKGETPPLPRHITDILERVSDGFVAFDAQMNYTYVNTRGAEMLGRTPENLIGKNYWVEFPEAKGTPFANAYTRALETQESMVMEDYYAPWERWFENRIYPSKDGLTIFFSEITEKKKAEEELHASERRLSAAIANSPDIIYILDLSTGKAPLFNREEFFGYSRVEMESPGSILAAVHPDDLPRVQENWKQSMAGKGSPFEYRLRTKSGEIAWISQRVTILGRNEQGAPAQILVTLSDITERKQAEDQLRLSEERFSNAFYTSPVGLTITRIADGKFVDANDAFCKMFEFSREEVIGHTSPELKMWTPEERKKLIDEQIRSGGLQNFELRARSKSGRMVDILFSSKPMELAGELHHVTTMIDITERKRAEEKLAYQAFLLKNVNDAILVTDEQRIITSWNHAAEKMFGWTAEQALGCPINEIVRTDFSEEQRNRAMKDLAEIGQYKVEVRAARHDGQMIWVEGLTSALRGGDGSSIGYLSINRDITERKRAEADRINAFELSQKVFHSSPLPTILTRLPERVIIDANKAFELMMGYTRAEVIGRSISEFDLWADPIERESVARILMTNGVVFGHEFVYKTKSVQTGTALFYAELFEQGTERYVLTKILDITERKQAEEALLRSNEQLRELSRRLSETEEMERRNLARELHDRVGQTLTALNINLNIIRSQLAEDSEKMIGARIDDSVQLVEETVTHVRDVMADLHPPVLADYGLTAALRWYAEQFTRRTEIAVSVEEAGGSGVRFASHLEAVLFRITQEALTNIARHAGAKQVVLKFDSSGNAARLTIQDDGRGFDTDTVFTGEQQGWGLQTMRERIEAVGGTFRLESAPGRGTKIFAEITPRKF